MSRTYLTRSAPDLGEVERRRWMFRHPAVICLTHWVNAICLLVLQMSGLQIFNAHPALYRGKVSTFDAPLLSMSSTEDDPPKGVTTLLGRPFDTTGYLGSSAGSDGEPADRGFLSWLTLPSDQDLSGGRSWHFFFAWAFSPERPCVPALRAGQCVSASKHDPTYNSAQAIAKLNEKPWQVGSRSAPIVTLPEIQICSMP